MGEVPLSEVYGNKGKTNNRTVEDFEITHMDPQDSFQNDYKQAQKT